MSDFLKQNYPDHITDGIQFDDVDDAKDFPELDDEYEDDQPDAFGLRSALLDIATPPVEEVERIYCKRCKIIRVRDFDDFCASCYEEEIEHIADSAREQV